MEQMKRLFFFLYVQIRRALIEQKFAGWPQYWHKYDRRVIKDIPSFS